jgi:polyisoprenoid-binding protein YceI
MKTHTRALVSSSAFSFWLVVLASSPIGNARAETVQGAITFLAQTNVPGFKFSGETKEFASRIERKGMALGSLEVKIPVDSLKTGMEVRDKHMRERVFAAADGTLPDIVFKAGKSACHPAGDAGAQDCEITGTLSLRGESKPYVLKASVTPSGAALRVKSHALVDVLQFGVAPEKLKWTKIEVNKDAVIDFDVEVK